jgi:hypothetical protein
MRGDGQTFGDLPVVPFGRTVCTEITLAREATQFAPPDQSRRRSFCRMRTLENGFLDSPAQSELRSAQSPMVEHSQI